jgi:hypothetical protein
MDRIFGALFVLVVVCCGYAAGQAARAKTYSESRVITERVRPGSDGKAGAAEQKTLASATTPEMEVITVETDLVIVPFRVTDKRGRVITDITEAEVRIFEDDEQREIAWFSNTDQPFTVALLLDMSYSSVFKLQDIQTANPNCRQRSHLLRCDELK